MERKELYIMTKVWNDMHTRVEEACRKGISDLQCDYINIYFMQWSFFGCHAPWWDEDGFIVK